MAQQDQANDSYQRQYEVITSVARIASILRPLQQEHAIVSIALPGAKRIYNSTLLEVDTEAQQLLLDELHPADGHALLTKLKKLVMSMHRDGMDIRLALEITEIRDDNGVALYQASFPESIRYRQRRGFYRVPVGAVQVVPVELVFSENNSLFGELYDISAQGMCIRFPHNTKLPVEKSNDPVQCHISLPHNIDIHCALLIRHIDETATDKRLHVGGLFESLDKAQGRAIERFSVELQRQSRRNMTRQ